MKHRNKIYKLLTDEQPLLMELLKIMAVNDPKERICEALNVVDRPKVITRGNSKIELPKYVSLNGTALRLQGNEYWRDAGWWGVGFKVKDGKVFSSHWRQGHDWLHDVELIPITEKQWRKDNQGYVK